MSGTRSGIGRVVALAVALGLTVLLLVAREAEAAKYSVAECGWHLGADAGWADTTGGTKFRPDAYCATPAGADPFDGAHLKSLTTNGATVSGTRYARWRWEAPAGTAITRVSGTWWQALHDGMEQRIGVGTWGGGFTPFATAATTNVTPRNFVAGFSPGMPALEDRLLCARAQSKSCSLDPGSWSALRALTITVEDNNVPAAGIGGDLLAGGWRRGSQNVDFWGGDTGAGIRYGETTIDGARVNLTEYPCAKALIGSEWRATQMRPCNLGVSARATIGTGAFSDGPHSVRHCVTDFAGNVGCTGGQTVAIDNNAPAHPRALVLAGGEGWRRVNDFDLSWSNPDQGPASPIGAALWQITGPAGFDSGVKLAPGRGIAALADRTVPGPGTYELHLWLRDEAGNESPASAITVPLRLDNVAPGVAFEPTPAGSPGSELPETVAADVSDLHSGPAGGEIHYRRLGTDRWIDLATKLLPGEGAGAARLVAQLPDGLAAGTYSFRGDAADAAGNVASTTRRADGTEMALRRLPAPSGAGRSSSSFPSTTTAKTRLFARLRWRGRRGPAITVPFGVAATLSGRFVNADGAGLAGRRLRVVSRPSRGALDLRRVETVTTGPHGGYVLRLSPGPSRRITVSYPGEAGLDRARRPALALRVRGAVLLRARPRSLRTGQVVSFWGRVRTRGAPLPRRGKLIAIQYYESAAHRWRPVLVTRTDHSGHFRARYRFRYVSGSATIRLRAVAIAEERWPYVPGASKPLVVHVSG